MVVTRDNEFCFSLILVIAIIAAFSGAGILFDKEQIFPGVLLIVVAVGLIIFIIIYTIKFFQARLRGLDPYDSDRLLPNTDLVSDSDIKTEISMPSDEEIRNKILYDFGIKVVYDSSINNWGKSSKNFGPIRITSNDLPYIFKVVINEIFSTRFNKNKNTFDIIAKPFREIGITTVKKEIEIEITEFTNEKKTKLALYLYKIIESTQKVSIDQPMFTLDTEE